MVTYYLLYDWQSQSGPFGLSRFKKVKWIEILGHPFPGIAKFQNDIVASPVGSHREMTSFGHSFDRVFTKIQDDLLYFCGIKSDQRQGLVKFKRNVNAGILIILGIGS